MGYAFTQYEVMRLEITLLCSQVVLRPKAKRIYGRVMRPDADTIGELGRSSITVKHPAYLAMTRQAP
jgi:hypothetical protein